MAEGMQTLRAAKIGRDRRLLFHGVPLTSEKLRSVIDTAILQACGLAANTIVAAASRVATPMSAGSGRCARMSRSSLIYSPARNRRVIFGDITRTVVRGRASEGVRRLYDTVLQGQKLALRKMRAGTATAEIHRAVQDYFTEQGYRTGRQKGRMEGFFHGTGHGLGLEIHEARGWAPLPGNP